MSKKLANPFSAEERESRQAQVFRDPEPETRARPRGQRPADVSMPCERLDHEANLAEIRAGLRPWPARPVTRLAQSKQLLVLVCSALGRAVAVFALCFAASTLALRQSTAQVLTPSVSSPSREPTGKTGSCECAEVRS